MTREQMERIWNTRGMVHSSALVAWTYDDRGRLTPRRGRATDFKPSKAWVARAKRECPNNFEALRKLYGKGFADA